MSKQIDQRVVEIQFDNSKFESNVKTTMSTLERLKQSLRLKGAEKGFDNLDKSAKKVDMTHLGKAVETVQAKFSALEVIGVTALANITNSAINAGKRMISALTIDPIKTGFQEYETQMNAVQTILANTASKGSTLQDVNAALDELNTYADKTIYNFTEMTRNIGTFTAAGVDLDTSVNAIQGIANLAAVSGSTSQQASTAMYQLSQALASGTVKLMDWNSVVNAGMGGEMFQNALKETSELLGTGAEAAIAAEGSFRESLKSEWLTAEVLTETLKKFTTSGANEYIAEYTGLSKEAVEASLEAAEAQYGEAEAIEKASEALAEKSGKSKEEIKTALQFAKTAEDAATKVKTFSQLWDVMKESAQSGWAQTWKLLVGDFEQAKSLLTPLADFFTGAIGKMSEARNKLLGGALGKGFGDLANKIAGITKPIDKTVESVKGAVDALKDYSKVVDEIIRGDFGNGEKRFKALADAGYDWAHAQNLVNEKLGDSTRIATDYKEAQKGVNEAQEEAVGAQTELTKAEAKRIEQLAEMSDAELKNLGYTKDQIQAFRELKTEADKLGMPISEFVSRIDELNGRTILIDSFKNAGMGLVKAFTAIKDAWVNIFPPMTSDQLYNIIAGIHKLSTHLRMSDETANKLRRTFEGLFAALDIVLTIVGGPIKMAFKILGTILEGAGLTILDVTAFIGDAIVGFRDWIDSVLDFGAVLKPIGTLIESVFKTIGDWFNEFKQSEEMQSIIGKFKEFAEAIKLDEGAASNFQKIVDGLTTLSTKLSYVLNASLLSGLKVLGAVLNLFGVNLMDVAAAIVDYLGKAKKWVNENILIANTVDEVANIIVAVIKGIKELIDAFMGLKSVQKFIEGIKNTFSDLFGKLSFNFDASGLTNFIDLIENAFSSIKKWIQSLDQNESFQAGLDVVAGLANGILSGISSAISAAMSVATAVINAVKSVLGIHSPSTVMMAIGKFAIAGLILGLLASKFELLGSIKDIGSSMLNWFKASLKPLMEWFKNLKLPEIKLDHILAVGGIVTLVVAAKKVLDVFEMFGRGVENFGKGVAGAGKLMSALADRISPKESKFENVANSVLKMAISIGILAMSVGLLAKVAESGNLWPAIGAIAVLAAVVVALAGAAKLIGGAEGGLGKLAISVVGIALAVAILAGAIKKLEFLSDSNIGPIKEGLYTILIMLGSLALISKIPVNVTGMLATFIGISLALAIMVKVVKQMSDMDPASFDKGFSCVEKFAILIMTFMLINKIPGSGASGLGAMFAGIAMAMVSMVAVVKMMSSMDEGAIKKGYQCIVAFALVIGGLMLINKIPGSGAGGLAGTFIGVSMALLAMATCVRIMGSLDEAALKQGVKAIAIFAAIIAGLIVISKIGGQAKGIAATLIAVSVALGVMAGIVVIMGLVSEETLKKGMAVVVGLGVMLAILIGVSKLAANSKGSIYAIAVVLGVLVASVVVLSKLTGDELIGATICIGVLMGMLSLMFGMSKLAAGSVGAILSMTVLVGALAGVIYLVAQLPAEQAIVSASVLAGFLVVMTGVLGALAFIGKFTMQAIIGVGSLLLLCVPLLAIVSILKKMEGVENAQASVTALSIMLGAMTIALGLLAVIGYFATGGAIAGAIALLVLCVPLLAIVSILKKMEGLENAQANVTVLCTLLSALGELMVILALTGPLALVGVAALNSLMVLIGAIGIFATAIGALVTAFPALEQFLNTGLDLLKRLASGIGEMIGAFVGGIASGFAESLPAIGAALSSFITSALPFIAVASTIDGSLMEGVGNLVKAILLITAADFISGIKSFFGGGVDFDSFGATLIALGECLVGFKESMSDFSAEDITIVETAAKALKALVTVANDIPNDGGWAGKIFGENNLGAFAGNIKSTGECLADFAETMKDFGEDDLANAVRGANAIKEFTTIADTIPNSGGLAGVFAGENNLGNFAEGIKSSGECLADFAESMVDFGDDDIEVVKRAVTAIKEFTTIAGTIPNSGGLAAVFSGDNNLGNFSEDIVATGECLSDFAETMKDFGEDDVAVVGRAVGTLQRFSNIANISIPSKDNSKNLINLAEDIVDVGEELSEFGDSIGEFGEGDANKAIEACKVLKQFSDVSSTVGGKGDSLSTFATGLKKFATEFKSAMSSFGKVNVESAKNAVKGIKELMGSLDKIVVPDLSGLVKQMTSLGKLSISGFADGMSSGAATVKSTCTSLVSSIASTIKSAIPKVSASAKSMMTMFAAAMIAGSPKVLQTMRTLMSDLANAVRSGTAMVVSAVQVLITSAAAALNSGRAAFVTAGTYVAQGFAAGITSGSYAAINAARQMVISAKNAANAEAQIKSPSRVFMESGSFVVQGFAKGILDNLGFSNNAAIAMASGVLTATQDHLGIHSPSVVFNEEVGRYIVQGIAEGIEEDDSAEKAAKEKADKIVSAFNKEFERLDREGAIATAKYDWFMADEGRIQNGSTASTTRDYLQGVIDRNQEYRDLAYSEWEEQKAYLAKGESTLEAVEDAEKKYYEREKALAESETDLQDYNAKQVSNTSDDRIEAITTRIEDRQRSYETWLDTEGKNASDSEKRNRLIALKEAEAKDYEAIATAERQKSSSLSGYVNSVSDPESLKDQSSSALKNAKDAAAKAIELRSEISDLVEEGIQENIEDLEKRVENNERVVDLRNESTELWLKSEGKYKSEAEKSAKLVEAEKANLDNLLEARKTEQLRLDSLKEYLKTASDEEEVMEQINDALEKLNELDSNILDSREFINAEADRSIERGLNKIKTRMEYRNKEYELAVAELGHDPGDDRLYSYEQNRLNAELEDLEAALDIEKGQFLEMRRRFYEGKASLEDVNKEYGEYLDARTEVAKTQNEIEANEVEYLEKQLETRKKIYELTSSNADLQYDLWEKTAGRKATGAEKDLMQISTITDKLVNQEALLEIANQEWKEAVDKYGQYSEEAQDAYNKYLQKQVDIASLQEEIADISDRTVARQRAAVTEYGDYIEKYKKYYELNGMTQEDLERDAKLVSGYDPNKTVTNMINSANETLKNIQSSSEYSELIENYKGIGQSWIDAVDTGIQSKVAEVASTALLIATKAIEKIEDTRPKWVEAGKYVTEGLAVGIKEYTTEVVKAAVAMAVSAKEAVENELGINSPSREFAELGMYAVKGFARGIVENTALSDVAATELGNKAIDNLRNTISTISSLVESDIDCEPTIRPVLDLSDIDKGCARLNTMFSTEQAFAAKAGFERNRNEAYQSKDDESKVGNTYEFVQNNYSPKALSAVDIYRQTRNQFAAIKGALK